MKHLRLRTGWSILLALALTIGAGCREKQQQQASPPEPVDPATSFDRVVNNLRHYLGQLESGPITSFENGAYTNITHSRQVTGHKLIPPADEAGDYRGVIDVTAKWSYSYQPSLDAEPLDSSKNQKAAKRKDSQASAKEFASTGVEVLDSDLISEAGQANPGANPLLAGSLDTSQSEEQVRKFQFVFKNDRWEFVEEVEVPASDSDQRPEKTSTEEEQGDSPAPDDGPDTVLDAVDRALAAQ